MRLKKGEDDDKTRVGVGMFKHHPRSHIGGEVEVEVKEEVEDVEEKDKTRSRSWNVQAPPPRSLS